MTFTSPEERAVKDRIRLQGRNLVTAKAPPFNFRALLNKAPAFDPETPLGSDPREKAVMEILRPGPNICVNDFIEEVGTKNKWIVVYQDLNPADLVVVQYLLAVVLPIDT